MSELLSVALLLFTAFTVSHYSLSQVWNNQNGVLIVSAALAVLVLMFRNTLSL